MIWIAAVLYLSLAVVTVWYTYHSFVVPSQLPADNIRINSNGVAEEFKDGNWIPIPPLEESDGE